jgi:hypothetical protein
MKRNGVRSRGLPMGKVVKFASKKKAPLAGVQTPTESMPQSQKDTIAAILEASRAQARDEAVPDLPSKAAKPVKARRPRETRPFLHVDRDTYTVGVIALGCPQAAVWAFILQRWRMTGEPVAVTNVALKEWRVGRKVKYAALRKLAKAGLIRVVEGSISRNPRVVPVQSGVFPPAIKVSRLGQEGWPDWDT